MSGWFDHCWKEPAYARSRRIVLEGTPADLVAARSTLTGAHLTAYLGT